MSESRKAVGRMGHSGNLRVALATCPECGSPFDRGCGAKFHDTAPPAPEGFDPVAPLGVCKHGPIQYVDDGAPYCPDCDQEAAQDTEPLVTAVRLLDEFDRYASIPATAYNGSPFQAEVRAFLAVNT